MKLAQAYRFMIIAQTSQVGEADFRDVVDMCCMCKL